MTTEKLLKTIKSVKPGRYRCGTKDIIAIRDAVGDGVLEVGASCFMLGFAQGQKAAKAEMKRETKKLMERDMSGWYGYLSRWLERNIDNKELIEMAGKYVQCLGESWLKKRAREAAQAERAGEGTHADKNN